MSVVGPFLRLRAALNLVADDAEVVCRQFLRDGRGLDRAKAEPRDDLDNPAGTIRHAHSAAFVPPAQLRQLAAHQIVPAG